MPAVTSQPISLHMAPYHDCDHPRDEKHIHDSTPNTQCDSGHRSSSDCDCESRSHNRCHNSRLRRFLIPAATALLTISAMLLISCLCDFGSVVGGDGLWKRATDSTGSSNGFVDNKLYLIVIFVGLFLVLIFAVMLSAWCCRGVFENPCCCPCYLCACCGGLACLECIGCGLCAAAEV